MIDAFQEQIGSAVETAFTNKLKEGTSKLDSLLQSLPREIPVNDKASLNVTFVNEPLLSNSSIEFDINGLFTPVKMVSATEYYDRHPQPLVYCNNPSKMLGISLDEAVFNSALASYYDVSSNTLEFFIPVFFFLFFFLLIFLWENCVYIKHVLTSLYFGTFL